MTCIVGLVDGGTVWMGADSLGSNGWSGAEYRTPKLFRRDGFLIGYTNSFRMGQILRHSLTVDPIQADQDVEDYMVTVFVESVRESLKDAGYLHVKDNQETGGTFLVGFRGRLFCVHDDLAVLESAIGMDCCGCGRAFALGSLHSTRGAAQTRVRKALEAAAAFSVGVGGALHVEKLEP